MHIHTFRVEFVTVFSLPSLSLRWRAQLSVGPLPPTIAETVA